MAEEDQGAEPGMEDRMKITRPQKITVFFTAIFVTGMALITGVSDMAAADENNGEPPFHCQLQYQNTRMRVQILLCI